MAAADIVGVAHRAVRPKEIIRIAASDRNVNVEHKKSDSEGPIEAERYGKAITGNGALFGPYRLRSVFEQHAWPSQCHDDPMQCRFWQTLGGSDNQFVNICHDARQCEAARDCKKEYGYFVHVTSNPPIDPVVPS